jgi:hypothetical protein
MALLMIKQGMTSEAVAEAFPKVFKMIRTDSGERKLGMKYDVKLPDGGKDVSHAISANAVKYAIQKFKRMPPKGDPTGWNNPVREAEYKEYLKEKKITDYDHITGEEKVETPEPEIYERVPGAQPGILPVDGPEKIVEPVVRPVVTPVAVSVPPDDYEVKVHTEAECKKYFNLLKKQCH